MYVVKMEFWPDSFYWTIYSVATFLGTAKQTKSVEYNPAINVLCRWGFNLMAILEVEVCGAVEL